MSKEWGKTKDMINIDIPLLPSPRKKKLQTVNTDLDNKPNITQFFQETLI